MYYLIKEYSSLPRSLANSNYKGMFGLADKYGYIKGTQRLLSAKYLFGEARELALNFLCLRTAKTFCMAIPFM